MYTLGALKDQYNTINGINVSEHVVKKLGIYLRHDNID